MTDGWTTLLAYCGGNMGSEGKCRRNPLVLGRQLPCERCGTMVVMLIFAPGATDRGGFEDYARKMYAEYTRLDLQTWIIGPALGGPLMERPAEILKIWPSREPLERQRPAEFNALLDRLVTEHCGLG